MLDDHRVLASVGSVGDAYDNAMAESFVDTFKTELIKDRVWQTRSQLELASLNTSTGSTTAGCTSHSTTCRRSSSKPNGPLETALEDEPDPARTAPSLVVDESSQLVSLTLQS